jgi:CO dehydrogenase/acetyl-CoA synthase alpha subunit
VQVARGGTDITVAKQQLNGTDVNASFEQMGGKAVAARFDIMLHLTNIR